MNTDIKSAKTRLYVGTLQWAAGGVLAISGYMAKIGAFENWDWFLFITGTLAYLSTGLVALGRFFGVQIATNVLVEKPAEPAPRPEPSILDTEFDSFAEVDRRPRPSIPAAPTRKAFVFGRTSEKHLAQSDPAIARVHRTGLKLSPIDFALIDSLREVETQRENIRKGVSWTMETRHLERPLAKAIDHVPIVNGHEDWSWEAFEQTTNALKEAARLEGVPCTHGIDWEGVRRDGAHTELDRDVYPYITPDVLLPT